MKTVHIPKSESPMWECNVNNVVYSYPQDTDQTVPDAVASIIDSSERAIPKQDKTGPSTWLVYKQGGWATDLMGGGGGGDNVDFRVFVCYFLDKNYSHHDTDRLYFFDPYEIDESTGGIKAVTCNEILEASREKDIVLCCPVQSTYRAEEIGNWAGGQLCLAHCKNWDYNGGRTFYIDSTAVIGNIDANTSGITWLYGYFNMPESDNTWASVPSLAQKTPFTYYKVVEGAYRDTVDLSDLGNAIPVLHAVIYELGVNLYPTSYEEQEGDSYWYYDYLKVNGANVGWHRYSIRVSDGDLEYTYYDWPWNNDPV